MAHSLNDAEVAKISERARQRIAHDLHDGLGQLLGGIALKLQALHESLAEKESPQAAETADLVALVNEALAQTRLLSRGLDPVLPAAASLSHSLAKLARDTARLFRGVECHFSQITAPLDESPITAEHLFRVAQEAINNAIRHSKATRIELHLRRARSGVELRIRDNGRGLPRNHVRGTGIRVMQERALAVGAALQIGAVERGKGTEVALAIEVPEHHAVTR